MRWPFRRKTTIIPAALGTSQAREVRDLLDAQGSEDGEDTVRYRVVGEAVTTDALYALLDRARLVVVDLDQLQAGTVGREALATALDQVVHVSSAAFLADPAEFLLAARSATGVATYPPRVVACARTAGGVGATTIALSAAHAFARQTRLPVALAELAYGPSPLRAALDGAQRAAPGGWPDLFDLATHPEVQPGQWQGIDVYPMTEKYAANLLPSQLAAYLHQVQAAHILTVLDLAPSHPLAAVLQLPTEGAAPFEPLPVDVWLVLARSGRPDSLMGAADLASQLRDRQGGRVVELVNCADALDRVASVAGAGAPLPQVRGLPNERLGRQVLRHIYPGAF